MRYITLFLLCLPFYVLANTHVAYDVSNDTVINGSVDKQMHSIASITKLMTVYTILEFDQNLEDKLTVKGNKTPNTRLSKGMTLTRKELIKLTLISSDNLAAITLAENFPGGHAFFVNMMNNHAQALGMLDTRFVEPTGLSPMNYSTINDIIILTKAVSTYDIVKQAAKLEKTATVSQHKKAKEKSRNIPYNPTSSFFGREGIVTIKTGFTRAAGFCITILVNKNNQLYSIVVLGAKSLQERQKLVESLLKQVYNA